MQPNRCMIKQVIIRYTDISTLWRGVSASIIAPQQIYTLPEPKGFILFYVSYTSCGSCNDTLLLRKNGPPVVLADHKRGQKGAKK